VLTFDKIEKNNGTSTLYQVAMDKGIVQTRPQVLPGRFYQLKAVSPVVDLNERVVPIISDGKPYYDLYPLGLMLYHDNWKETALILNLKVIPPQAAAKILEAYYAFAMSSGLTNLYRDGKLIPLEERRTLDLRFYMIPPGLLARLVGANNFNYAINKYNMDLIAEARLIDWDNFGKLIKPRFTSMGLFPETINLQEIYEDFITNTFT